MADTVLTMPESQVADSSTPNKATLALAHLQRALRLVSPALPGASAVIQSLRSIRMEQLPEGLKIRASDGDIAVTALIPENTTLKGVLQIPSERFFGWVKLLRGESIRLSSTDRRVSLQCGTAKASIPLIKSIPEAKFGKGGEVAIIFKQSALGRYLHYGAFAQGDESRYTLNGSLLKAEKGTVSVVSTDGHRLAIYTAPCPDTILALLPDAMVSAIKSSMSETGDDVSFQQNESSIFCNISSDIPVFIESHRLTGSFPAYDRVMPEKFLREITTNAEALVNAVERCALIGDHDSKAIVLTFERSSILIHSSDANAGESDESVDAMGGTADPVSVGMNSKYLLDGLKRITGDVRFQINSPMDAVVLIAEPEDGEEFKYIVMPLWVQK